MVYPFPKKIEIKLLSYNNNNPLVIKQLSRRNSSNRLKFYVRTEKHDYFVKNIDKNLASKIQYLYKKLQNNKLLTNHLPDLIMTEENWIVYEWMRCHNLINRVLIYYIMKRPFIKLLFYDIGKWLANFHQAINVGSAPIDKIIKRKMSSLSLCSIYGSMKLPVCKSYNDFTMRNILINKDNCSKFFLIDIDAAFHPQFPCYTFPYHDLAIFICNIYSLMKIPLIKYKFHKKLIQSFLEGYFCTSKILKYDPLLLKLFLVLHYEGHLIDRPTPLIYGGLKNVFFRKKIFDLLFRQKLKTLLPTLHHC